MTPTRPSLDDRLTTLRSALADVQPPPSTDRAIDAALARARRRSTPAPASRHERWLAWPIALAASIALLGVLLHRSAPDPTASGALASAPVRRFLPVVPDSEIARSTDAYVVAARMPRMALAQFGLPVNPALASDAIDTELLVRPDGAVLAMRFVR